MEKRTGFKTFQRELPKKRAVGDRIKDFAEIYIDFQENKVTQQASRCMDCGVPFCHVGCPLGNLIPDWNTLINENRWHEAYLKLSATNNFPEFTGRLCPAPCEESCVLGITDPPVTIELIEKEIVERAFSEGWIKPILPKERTGKRVAIVGSGPAGLAAAQQLNYAGHYVTVFERADAIGGLLRYGIPDFKMEKSVLERRIEILLKEEIKFVTDTNIGVDISVDELIEFDAILLCIGATNPRALSEIPGSNLSGIHFAMDYLTKQNKYNYATFSNVSEAELINAKGKNVIVIGGGDTASDCIGTANRQGAKSIVNFDYHVTPPLERPTHQPWPYWPDKLRTSASHEEGCKREWKVLTQKFIGKNGKLTAVQTVDVEWLYKSGKAKEKIVIPGTEKQWDADLVLVAIGYNGVEKHGWLSQLGVTFNDRGNIKTNNSFQTEANGIFAAGDSKRGQSLIVWAISEGREAAREIDIFLNGYSDLPTKGLGNELQ